MSRRIWITLILLLIFPLTLSRCTFICGETEVVLVTQFGKIVRELGTEASQTGLFLKWPWQNVLRIDRRSQVSDIESRDLLTADKKNLQIGVTLIWRVADARKFVESANDFATISARLSERASAESAQVLSGHELNDLISVESDRPGFMAVGREIAESLNQTTRDAFGVEISAVMLTQVSYPTEIRPAIFDQIRAERAQVASQIRAEAKAKSDQLLAEALRERETQLAKARSEATAILARSEAEALGILNEAHSQDPKFYELVRMLETYRTLADSKTTVVISSGSPLWKLLWQGPTVDFSRDSPPAPDLGPAPEPIAPSPLAPKPEVLESPK